MTVAMTDLIGRTVRTACLNCKKPTAQTKDTEVVGYGHVCLACRASVCGCGHAARSHPHVPFEAIPGVEDQLRGPCRFCDCGKMNPAKTAWGAAVLLRLCNIKDNAGGRP